MKRTLSSVALVLSLSSAVALAQEFRGTISGKATDPSGAAAANVKVTVTEAQTNTSVSTQTDSAGAYTIPFLAPGVYTLTSESAGFKKYVREGIELRSGDHPEIDIPLEVGDVTQSVNVTESVSLLNTDNASVGQ